MTIEQEYHKWVEKLRELDLPVVEMLLPGIDSNHIRRSFADIGLDCPDDLVEFYGYCGGVNAPEGALLNHMWMFGSHYILPFDKSLSDYKSFSKDERWNLASFPILGNDGGDFYSIRCIRERDDWGQISSFMLNSGIDEYLAFSSIFNMLFVINECFSEKLCYVDQNRNLRTDFRKVMVNIAKYNANLPYYNLSVE